MAAETNTFRTVEAIGNREDLADAIYDISPEETPGLSNSGRSTATNPVAFDWQTDALDDVDTANFRAEGNQAVVAAITPTVRLVNSCQISDKVFAVSRSQEKAKSAGRKSEAARALTRKMAALKRDMEAILFGLNQARQSSEPRKTASLLSWITTNTSIGTGAAADPTGDGTDTRTDGTQRAFLESHLQTVLESMWNEGGKVDGSLALMGSFNKRQASAFTGIAEIRKAAEGAKRATIIGAADEYVGDFGNVTFVPSHFTRTRDVLILDPDMVDVAYFDTFNVSDLAKIGDTAARKLITVEYGLRVRNEKGLGAIYDLTTS